jgi:hypothetical protein
MSLPLERGTHLGTILQLCCKRLWDVASGYDLSLRWRGSETSFEEKPLIWGPKGLWDVTCGYDLSMRWWGSETWLRSPVMSWKRLILFCLFCQRGQIQRWKSKFDSDNTYLSVCTQYLQAFFVIFQVSH